MPTNHAEQARALIAVGFPALHERMDEVFGWLGDSNCPAHPIVSEFLVSAGPTVLPHVRSALRGKDVDLKHALVTSVVAHWPPGLIAEVADDLLFYTSWEDELCAEVAALELLMKQGVGQAARARERLERIRSDLQYRLDDVADTRRRAGTSP